MSDRGAVEDLLRASQMAYGHIQLFRDEAGWHVSVNHYRTPTPNPDDTFTLANFGDPVEALRCGLIEDDRRTRDLERKYAASKKGPPEPAPCDEDGMCVICEDAGCHACFVQIDLEDYLAETAPAALSGDPMADMFG